MGYSLNTWLLHIYIFCLNLLTCISLEHVFFFILLWATKGVVSYFIQPSLEHTDGTVHVGSLLYCVVHFYSYSWNYGWVIITYKNSVSTLRKQLNSGQYLHWLWRSSVVYSAVVRKCRYPFLFHLFTFLVRCIPCCESYMHFLHLSWSHAISFFFFFCHPKSTDAFIFSFKLDSWLFKPCSLIESPSRYICKPLSLCLFKRAWWHGTCVYNVKSNEGTKVKLPKLEVKLQ